MITLPTNFESDIQGQNLNLFPIVIIGNFEGVYSTVNAKAWMDNSIHLSTKSFSHTASYGGSPAQIYTSNTKPLLLNIPSIKESMDFENRKYKISNVTLKISNFEHGGERFSDYAGNLINEEVRIFWWSKSTLFLMPIDKFPTYVEDYPSGKPALLTYKGFIRRYSHDDETVTLQLEDSTQGDLHADVPVARLGDNNTIPDKYKLKPIPMVYGYVERSPCVIRLNNSELLADNNESIVYQGTPNIALVDSDSPLYFSTDSGYVNIIRGGINDENADFQSYDNQFEITNNIINFNYNNKDIFPDFGSDNDESIFNALDSLKTIPINLGNEKEASDWVSTDFATEEELSGLIDLSYEPNQIEWALSSGEDAIRIAGSSTEDFNWLMLQFKMFYPPTAYDYISADLRSLAINGTNLNTYVPSDNSWTTFVTNASPAYLNLSEVDDNINGDVITTDYTVDELDGFALYDTVLGDVFVWTFIGNYEQTQPVIVDVEIINLEDFPYLQGAYSKTGLIIFQNVNNTFEIQFRVLGTIDNNFDTTYGDTFGYPFIISGNLSEIDLSRIVVAEKLFSQDFYANVNGRLDPGGYAE